MVPQNLNHYKTRYMITRKFRKTCKNLSQSFWTTELSLLHVRRCTFDNIHKSYKPNNPVQVFFTAFITQYIIIITVAETCRSRWRRNVIPLVWHLSVLAWCGTHAYISIMEVFGILCAGIYRTSAFFHAIFNHSVIHRYFRIRNVHTGSFVAP